MNYLLGMDFADHKIIFFLCSLFTRSKLDRMKFPCEAVGMIATFLCQSVQAGGLAGSASEMGKASGEFIMSQVPSLVALHVVDQGDVPAFISQAERIGKGFAEVLLTEREG